MTGADSGGQGPPPDGSDAEEAERCPICLGVPAEGELAMPDSCCHVFCLGCLLMWAELQVVPSCPVDRRPFRNVHRWDRSLRCVQIPVRRRVAEAEAEKCACRDAKNRVSLNKFRKRSRQQRAQKMDHSKTKGLVRKCNDDDSFSVNRKKTKGADCCAWPSSLFLSSTTATQDVQPLLLNKDAFNEMKKCKLQVQGCPWLSLAAPITASGISRFVPLNDNHGPFTFGLRSSPMTSTPSFGPDHFIFQGVVCAITCPKGGEKRGGRASNTEAPSKKAESLPSQRLGRNAKSQREPPASDPSSLPQSGSASDSDSSASRQTSKPSSASRVPVKRKGKRVTNRKAGGKRKNLRKKPSSEFVESPSASENDDGDEVDDNDEEEEKKEEEEEEEKEASHSEAKTSDAEGSLNTELKDVNSPDDQEGEDFFNNNVESDTNDTLEAKNSNQQTERPQPDDDSRQSCPSDSPPKSPESGSPDDKPFPPEEEPPVWSISTGDHEKTSPPPSEPDGTPDRLIPAECDNAIEPSDKTETGDERTERHDGKVWRHLPSESSQSPTLASPCPELSKEKVPDQEAKASERMAASGDVANDDALPKDDANVLPVDRGSPASEASGGSVLAVGAETPTAVVGDDEPPKDGGPRDPGHERRNGRQRRSRFHSPTSSWSPKRESGREPSRRSRSRSRSRSRERAAGSPPSSRCSRARSRERERQRDSGRRERPRRRSGTRSRSRSRSPSRIRSYRRGHSPQRPPSRDRSPRGNERGGGRRAGRGGGDGDASQQGRRYRGGAGRSENGVPAETSPERQGWSENPDWVTEKTRGESEGRNWDAGPRWEDRGHRGRGNYERGRAASWGGGFRNQQDDDNNNNRRPPWNNSGNDAYSRFNENRGGARRKPDSDGGGGDSTLDRSGWSSASSWAVRRTLPADVQDYYSKRERGGAGAWNRSEEEQQPAADGAKSEGATPTVAGNAPAPVLTAMLPPPPPQLNVLQHHFPAQGPRAPPPATLQPAAPYAVPPPIPVHIHPAVPPLRAPAVGAQGLPPPPPPPPPMHQGSQTAAAAAAAQPDGQTTQMASTAAAAAALGKAVLTPTPTRIGLQAVNPAAALPSSTTPAQHHKAQADNSKKEKKQQIQEKAINEVRTAIKPFYQNKEITKEEYKEIVRKAVEKICHSKSGEVNTSKVANLVKAYVDKYKHARKK
ncbi:uncharacterized protein scaf11 isoform X2 [Stigmatopora argus]